MPSRRATLLLCVTAGLALACSAMLGFLALRAPLAQQQARQRWQQRGPRHYELEATWANGMSYGHVRAEMLDNRLVAAVDLNTGQPPERPQLAAARFFASVDSLFGMIDEQIRPERSWRYQLARYHPLLAEWIDRCTASLPSVQYDPDFGYPASIEYYGNPCFNGSRNVSVTIDRFQPLP
jgi:hypothetical protein